MDLSNTEEIELSPNMCEPCTMLKEVSVQQKTRRAEDTLMRCPTRRRFQVQVATATAQSQNPRKMSKDLESTEGMGPGPGEGPRAEFCVEHCLGPYQGYH